MIPLWLAEALADAANDARDNRLTETVPALAGDTVYLRGLRDGLQLAAQKLDPHGPDSTELLREVWRSAMSATVDDD